MNFWPFSDHIRLSPSSASCSASSPLDELSGHAPAVPFSRRDSCSGVACPRRGGGGGYREARRGNDSPVRDPDSPRPRRDWRVVCPQGSARRRRRHVHGQPCHHHPLRTAAIMHGHYDSELVLNFGFLGFWENAGFQVSHVAV